MLAWSLIAIYLFASLSLMLYGLNCYVMVFLFMKGEKNAAEMRRRILDPFDPEKVVLPKITTQIPLYNEYNVAERVVRSVCAMTYPKDKHEIQVLDDSDDETADLVDELVRQYAQKGYQITCIRRENREGFKAGALQTSLDSAGGEYVAIFDADFVPPQDFLLKTVPFFLDGNSLGLVQARWGHLNPDVSMLTRAQSLGIDGHFMVEQAARNFNHLYMNFNGTAGIFRKSAIIDGGGWQCDTLTEDMDLSYRIQLAGWEALYNPDLVVPGEIPEDIRAFKSQQFRWAKGSIETAMKLLPSVFRSNVSLFKKVQAFFHMTHYMIHPLMLIVAVLAFPVIRVVQQDMAPLAFFCLALLLLFSLSAPSILYIVARHVAGGRPIHTLRVIPFLMITGTGIALSNSRAVMEALLGYKTGFIRTPKRGDRTTKNYQVKLPVSSFLELTLGVYCLFSFFIYIDSGRYLVGPFLAVYASGFLSTGVLTMYHTFGSDNP